MYKLVFILLLSSCLALSCSSDEPPVSPQPEVGEAMEIERNSALLSGSVTHAENASVESVCFRYGPARDMAFSVPALKGSNGSYEVRLDGLQAGTVYYYCLEVSGGKSALRSRVGEFRTLPNLIPSIGEVELVSKGPLSVAVKCSVQDAGGEDYLRIGFLYAEEGSATETFVAAATVTETDFSAQIGGLKMGTNYSVKACAANTLGEKTSEPFAFQTNSAIRVAEAGTLAGIIGEEWKYRLEEVTIAGELNGTDICFLREMLGKDVEGKDTDGRLEKVDLQDCRIVSGGKEYYSSRYTADHTVGGEMFAGCARLKQITLPQSVQTIEEDAFRGCAALTELMIPEKVSSVGYSSGCTQLAAYSVSPLNVSFSVTDGVLYSADRTGIVLYPMGKAGTSFGIPADVTRIEKNAFRESLLQTVTIPDKVKSIGEFAFTASALSSASIGNGLMTLSTGIFQQCRFLAAVTLGEDVRRVSAYAFSGCPALTDIKLLAVYPPTCEAAAFDDAVRSAATLSVPQGCKSIYSSSSWSGFSRIVETGN